MLYNIDALEVSNSLPSCIVPTSNTEFTAYYGSEDLYTGKISGTIFGEFFYPLTPYETGTYSPSHCLAITSLKHDEWVEVVFPFLSIILIFFALSMIYHIIFKRLMP